MKKKYDIVIVGAGISGCTIAERYANLGGKKILVIDSRDHVGGNCYDYYQEDGIRVSKYGPHYFHTNDEVVWKYVSKFTEWHPYEPRILSHVDGKKVPIPVNIKTVNDLFGLSLKTESDMEEWLKCHCEKIDNPKNSEESAISRVGRELYEKLFKGYTQKQWDTDPANLDRSILDRIPVRKNFDDRYFSDIHQAMPYLGYENIFRNMLKHENIELMLNTSWEKIRDSISWEKLFFTGKIDSYFAEKFGALDYRSVRFEFETFKKESFQDVAQENYPSLEVPFTRIVEYKKATGQKHPCTVISREYPIWGGEPFYPVYSSKNVQLYEKYKQAALLEEKNNVYFVGRLANYKYFNMDQAFKNALDLFAKIEEKCSTS